MKLAVKVKLIANESEKYQLTQAMVAVNRACNWIAEVAFTNKTFGQVGVHRLTYYEVKQRFSLSSQMAVRAIGKVVDVYKNKKQRDKQVTFSETGSIDYDDRNLSLKPNGLVSITTLEKRVKLQYHCKKQLSDYELCGQSELSYDKVNSRFYLTFYRIENEVAPSPVKEFIGVDLGIVNIATCSDGETFSGKSVEKNRKRLTNLKAALQSKGTKSSKRHLVKISKKENRYKKDINHTISKKLVAKAKALGCGIKLENLKHIRTKTPVMKFTKKLRDNNAKLGKWAFSQLRRYIEYKSKLSGVPVIAVNPAYSSQKCSCCGHTAKENRKSQSEFVCVKCGYSANADYNAAINISRADVNQPIAAVSSVKATKQQSSVGEQQVQSLKGLGS